MSQEKAQTTKFHSTFVIVGVLMLVLGAAGVVVGIPMSSGDPAALPHGYLFGWVFWACMTFGMCGLSILHHAARGHWGFPIIRLFEAGGGPINLAVFGAALIPIIVTWKQIFFPWARPEEVAVDPVLQVRAAFFSDAFYLGRIILYFAVFIGLAYLNQNWLKQEEKSGDDRWWKKRQYWGGIFLVLFVVCTNFLWTDVLMSQYAHWYSTIYGVWIMVGSCLLAFSMVAIIVGSQSNKAPYKTALEPWFYKDLGNWMLTFTMIWGYFSLSQYLIIWSGNLPEFTSYFIQRSKNGWGVLGTSLIFIHFLLPFLLLLSPAIKRSRSGLAAIGLYLLAVRMLDVLYLVTPAWKPALSINAIDIGMFLVFGGVWCTLFGLLVRKAPLITHRLPSMKEVVAHA